MNHRVSSGFFTGYINRLLRREGFKQWILKYVFKLVLYALSFEEILLHPITYGSILIH